MIKSSAPDFSKVQCLNNFIFIVEKVCCLPSMTKIDHLKKKMSLNYFVVDKTRIFIRNSCIWGYLLSDVWGRGLEYQFHFHPLFLVIVAPQQMTELDKLQYCLPYNICMTVLNYLIGPVKEALLLVKWSELIINFLFNENQRKLMVLTGTSFLQVHQLV